jgi:hypothetical protein
VPQAFTCISVIAVFMSFISLPLALARCMLTLSLLGAVDSRYARPTTDRQLQGQAR